MLYFPQTTSAQLLAAFGYLLSSIKSVCRQQVKIRRFIALLACLALCSQSWSLAPSQNSRFKSYLSEQGLAIGSVEVIIQDKIGFVWLGGTDGLARYDGYEFETFSFDEKDGGSISHNTIWEIFEDSKGNIWIGTEAGLNLFDRDEQRFIRFMHTDTNTNTIPNNLIRAITEDATGNLWVGTYGGMTKFNTEKNIFTRYQHQENNSNSLTSNLIRDLTIDHEGYVWIATEGGGLDQFDPEQEIFTHYTNTPEDPTSLPHNIVNRVYEDHDKRLWVGSDNGISLLNRKTATFTHFLHKPQSEAFTLNRVSAIHQDSFDNLWVGTDTGLFIREKGSESFIYIKRNALTQYTLTSNAIRHIFEDSSGDMWLGTFPEGVSYLDRNNMAFKTYSHNPFSADSISHSSVLSVVQNEKGQLLIGTDGGGLNVVNPKTGSAYAYRHDPNNLNTLSGDSILSIAIEKPGLIWAGTWGAGLNYFDINHNRFQRFYLDYKFNNTISSNNIWSLFVDSNQRVWAGTLGGGLNLYQPNTNTFKRYRHNPNDPKSIASPLIWDIFQDSTERMWFATGAGLCLYNEETDDFSRFSFPPTHPNALTINNLLTVHEGLGGNLWLGTRGAGLLKFNVNSKKFTHYNNAHGLINEMVVSIEQDDQGYLWLGTNFGLAKFSPEKEEFFNFDQTNGLQGNQFNLDASLRLKNGELVFGGTKGYTQFTPNEVKQNTTPPEIVFTEFQIFNKPVPIQAEGSALKKSINFAKEIKLRYDQSVFSIEFAALNFRHADRNQYAYFLDGFDKEWNFVGDQRSATYTNLDPGTYTFTVKASNNDGVWNEQGKSVSINILPPPWRTWWAYSLYFVAILLGIALFFSAQRRKIEYEIELNRQLEQQVAERTKELEEKNSELKTAYTKLEDISQSDPLTGLYNRRYLYRFLPHDSAKVIRAYSNWSEQKNSGPRESDLIFFLVDADHFKSVNDDYGHINGDRVLIQFSEILKHVCRESDCIVRWGGEEFLIVSRFTNRDQAPAIAERIRRSVENHLFQLDNSQTIQRTCSVGFACFPFNRAKPDDITPEQTIDIADRCLYMVKRNQRNGWMGFYQKKDADIDITALLDEPEKSIEQGTLGLQTSINRPLLWD